MKQILIVFVLIIFATASSDLLKSLSKFADNGDSSSKFAKSTVSPFSEEESEDYDSEDTEPSKKMAPKSQQDDNDDEVECHGLIEKLLTETFHQQGCQTPLTTKEVESEYDDEEDSGNMWSRGISKKLAQTESKPLVLPIQSAKEQIKNDYNQFTSLKMPEVQQRPQETKSQDQTQKVQEDPGKEHSADFEKMKQAQLEKYSKRFHLDEPKESKSMYEDDSLKEFMPKINFQPINIQETKTSQQVQSNPEKRQENKHDESESEDDEEEDSVEINKKSSLQSKISNKVTIDQKPNTDAFDFFNQSKQQQKSNKKSQRIEESEDEESESAQEVEDDEDYVQQVKKNKKQKEDKEEQKRKQKQLQQQQEEEEEQRRLMLKKQKEQQIQQEELRKKQEEEERQQELAKQQKLKRDSDEDQIPQKKKSKKQKKQLSLEEFQQSLKVDEEKPQLTSFAQKEAKEKAILEQKTFTLVKETPQQVQEQKVFKLQAVPKKQQQLIQEEESEGESESEDDNIDTPKSINCFESKNKFIQQICQLCQTKVAYQVNQQNWQKIGINDGFRQSFEPLIEFTFKSIGEVGSYYLSFKDHTVCLSAENLTKMTNVDKVLKHFTGNQLADYNSPVDIPAKSQPINFLLSAEYDSLLNGFSCRRFQIAIKTDLKYKLSKKNDINVKQIIFYKNKLKLKYIGLIQINGVVHQASFDQEEGGEVTNLIVTQLNLPKEQGVIASLVDKYVDSNFVADMLQKSGNFQYLDLEQMMADLQIQTHIKNDDIGLTFNLRKRKGK
ncbi:unnamed protein product (macronuclear) [Paramecium tetraurelia]|uniref:Transmembrane protein n=1 Tax=Paramecium tetraurelia TaxID=5888 RepID=A0D9B3_PARTE|nr:uncharacterized protein GSPATT00014560001 [Paramecium tetraurelia]CAK79630.1 unnamed protein product [Paramecium tetraurelia]|eukprot:XP_001447027.1 hypothetical protein (macronuclear) [Paramecium tetraurelia strain d4-2]